MGAAGLDCQPKGTSRAKASRIACALFAAATLAPLPAFAQVAQDHALMRSEIVDAATLQNDADMDFGDIIPSGTNGTVVMTPALAATCSTTGGLIRSGPCKAAEFSGTAFPGAILRVRRPIPNLIVLTGPLGATMRLHDFTFAKGTALMLGGSLTDPNYFVIGGTFIVFVGGTLDVARTQRPGIYNGTFVLSFNYN